MRRGRIFIFLILIIIIGAALAYVFINQKNAANQPAAAPSIDLVDIIVAAQPINQGDLIVPEQLATIQIPRENLVAVMYTGDQMDTITGKKALYPIAQGVPITTAMIGEPDQSLSTTGPEWATQLTPGETAIAVPISRLKSVAYGATDGAQVSVIACMLLVDVDPSFQSMQPNNTAVITGTGYLPDALPILSLQVAEGGPQGRIEMDPSLQSPFYVIPSEPQRPRPVCQMFFQNVRVMHLGDFPYEEAINGTQTTADTTNTTDAAANAPAAPQAQQQTQTPPPDVITLVMSPQDAVTMTYLIYSGAELTLTLRSPEDDTRFETEAATLQFILSQYNVAIPLKLPYALNPAIYDLEPPYMPNDTMVIQPQQ